NPGGRRPDFATYAWLIPNPKQPGKSSTPSHWEARRKPDGERVREVPGMLVRIRGPTARYLYDFAAPDSGHPEMIAGQPAGPFRSLGIARRIFAPHRGPPAIRSAPGGRAVVLRSAPSRGGRVLPCNAWA